MSEIKFKATRLKHDSGYAVIDKTGDLKYDQDKYSKDGIWLYTKNGERIMIDCDFKTKTFTLKFNGDDFEVANN